MIIKSSALDLKQIADSGQTFRFYDHGTYYVVVANHKAVKMTQLDDGVHIDDEDDFWLKYLDMSRNYESIIHQNEGKFAYLDDAMTFGKGIRILHQDAFEMVVTFIISANNNIKRITSAVTCLSEKYGEYLETIDGIDYYDFPTPKALYAATINDFRACGVGYRDKYLYELIRAIESGLDLEYLKKLSDKELKEALLRLKGVGEKVCNCILLFGYQRYDFFPVDTWIKKILQEQFQVTHHYGDFVEKNFQPNGGILQQYLFYYGRMKR